MPFTPAGCGADRSFELVRQSLLQSDELPFQEAFTAAQIRQAFDAEGVSFGQTDDRANDHRANDHRANDHRVQGEHRAQGGAGSDRARGGGVGETGPPQIVDTEGVTLWAMLSQALFTGVQRSCRAAVLRVAIYHSVAGRTITSTDTGGDCRARAKVTEGVVRRLAEGVDVAGHRPGLGEGEGTVCGEGDRRDRAVPDAVRAAPARRPGAGRPVLRRLVHARAAARVGRRVRDAAAPVSHGRLHLGKAARQGGPPRRGGQATTARVARSGDRQPSARTTGGARVGGAGRYPRLPHRAIALCGLRNL